MNGATPAYNSSIRRNKFQLKQPNPVEETEDELCFPRRNYQSQLQNQLTKLTQGEPDWQDQKLNFPSVLASRRSNPPIPMKAVPKTPKETSATTKYAFDSSDDNSSSSSNEKGLQGRGKQTIRHAQKISSQRNEGIIQTNSASNFYSQHKMDQHQMNLPSVLFDFKAKQTGSYMPYNRRQTFNYDNLIQNLNNDSKYKDDGLKTADSQNFYSHKKLQEQRNRTIDIKGTTRRNSRNLSNVGIRGRTQSTLSKIKQEHNSQAFSFGYDRRQSVVASQQFLTESLQKVVTNLQSTQTPQNLQQYFSHYAEISQQQWALYNLDSHQHRNLKKRILLEIISVLCVCMSVCTDTIESKGSYLSNLLHYALQNQQLQKNIKDYEGKTTNSLYRIANNNNIMVDLINKLLKQHAGLYQSIRIIIKGTYRTELSQSKRQLRLIICQIIHQHCRQWNFPTLSLAPAPYLPSRQSCEYTLAISLDDALVYQKNDSVHVRPFTRQFLYSLTGHFEIVLFSAIRKDLIDGAYDSLGFQAFQIPVYKLYRYHGQYSEITGRYALDLAKLGRPLQKIITVAVSLKGKSTSANSFYVKKWAGKNPQDSLDELATILKTISQSSKSRNVSKAKNQQQERRRSRLSNNI